MEDTDAVWGLEFRYPPDELRIGWRDAGGLEDGAQLLESARTPPARSVRCFRCDNELQVFRFYT